MCCHMQPQKSFSITFTNWPWHVSKVSILSTLIAMVFVSIHRNYHVFYYLLMGASEEERREFKLLAPEDYLYLKQVPPSTV